MFDLNESEMLEAAIQAARGLTDFGDSHFLTPLRILIASMNGARELRPGVHESTQRLWTHFLANRLRVQNDLKANPNIRDIPVEKPLFIMGFPRTGTTLLQNLLALDPTHRTLRFYELLSPSRPIANGSADDPRLAGARKYLEQPWIERIKHIHAITPESPEECHWLLRNSFASWVLNMPAELPEYRGWLRRQEMRWVYSEYKAQLKLLLWQRPGERLLLKHPFHMVYLPVLFETFPDAYVIQTHRSPSEFIASLASLQYHVRLVTYSSASRAQCINSAVAACAFALERNLAGRASIDGSRVYDVRYEDLMHAPVSSIRKIYDQFGLVFSPELETRIVRWLRENPQHRHGAHAYSLDDSDPGEIERRFNEYRARFGV